MAGLAEAGLRETGVRVPKQWPEYSFLRGNQRFAAGCAARLARGKSGKLYSYPGFETPFCQNPTRGTPIRAQAAPKPALVRLLPARQTPGQGRLNFLYADMEDEAMIRGLSVAAAILALSGMAPAQQLPVPPNTGQCLTEDEDRLLRLVNQYRRQNGLVSIRSSIWMTTTAQWHAWDLSANDPTTATCTLRSWSNARPDLWVPVCYTADHAQWNQMVFKPRQISGFNFPGFGYEIVVRGPFAGPEAALLAMIADPETNAMLLETGDWANSSYRGLGTGMVGDHATVWLTSDTDHEGAPVCPPPGLVFRDGFEPEGVP